MKDKNIVTNYWTCLNVDASFFYATKKKGHLMYLLKKL